jgi:hypothetical protein
MSRQLAPADMEKAAIAALLGNVAKLLLVMVDFGRYRDLSMRMAKGDGEAQAAHEVLGLSLKTLASEALSMWGIPERLVALCTATIDSKSGRLDKIVAMSKVTAQHLRLADGAEREALMAEVRRQCVADGAVSAGSFDRWVAAAETQMAPVRASLENVIPPPDAPLDRPAAGGRVQLIAEPQSLTAILLAALESLHTGFGFTISVLLLRDAGTPRFRARMWCGAISKAQAAALEIDVGSTTDLFAAAIRRGSDLQVQNTLAATIAKRLPHYFAVACPQTTSFILLPIVSDDAPIACILVGRDVPEPTPISREDIRLLHTIRGQIALAMKTVR